jgi:hypothetical protein
MIDIVTMLAFGIGWLGGFGAGYTHAVKLARSARGGRDE